MMSAPEPSPRKPYESPTLRVYGDLSEMTQGKLGNLGNFDNGVMGPKT
jgi:hypothetical protein